jgi:very-short-patch-repair endonuclease
MIDKLGIARKLRREQTNAERLLWSRLRNRLLCGWKFRRQVPVDHYVVDFLCADARLVVELDGGQHADRLAYDAERTAVLESFGYFVLRFWNQDVYDNLEGVLTEILDALEGRRLPPAE